MRLRWRGSRCWTTTSAAGKSAGSAPRTSVIAFRPPAEAAMATISNAGSAIAGLERPDQPAKPSHAAALERQAAHAEDHRLFLAVGGAQRRFPRRRGFVRVDEQ